MKKFIIAAILLMSITTAAYSMPVNNPKFINIPTKNVQQPGKQAHHNINGALALVWGMNTEQAAQTLGKQGFAVSDDAKHLVAKTIGWDALSFKKTTNEQTLNVLLFFSEKGLYQISEVMTSDDKKWLDYQYVISLWSQVAKRMQSELGNPTNTMANNPTSTKQGRNKYFYEWIFNNAINDKDEAICYANLGAKNGNSVAILYRHNLKANAKNI